MPNYERLLKDKFVNAVIYFSPTGGTEKIAKYAANYLNTSLISLTTFKEIESFSKLKRFNYLVFCFRFFEIGRFAALLVVLWQYRLAAPFFIQIFTV